MLERFLFSATSSWESTDELTFNQQLMAVTTESNSTPLMEKKKNDLVQLFIEFLHHEYNNVFPMDDDEDDSNYKTNKNSNNNNKNDNNNDNNNNDQIEWNDSTRYQVTLETTKGWRKNVNNKIVLFFKLFATCTKNVGGLRLKDTLHQILYRFLMKADSNIQKLSLDVLSHYKFPFINNYIERLQRLVTDKTFREEMTLFHLQPDSGLIEDSHRSQFIPVLIRVLLPKILQRKSSTLKTSLKARRAAILSFLGGLSSIELSYLIVILLRPFHSVLDRAGIRMYDANSIHDNIANLRLELKQPLLLNDAVYFLDANDDNNNNDNNNKNKKINSIIQKQWLFQFQS